MSSRISVRGGRGHLRPLLISAVCALALAFLYGGSVPERAGAQRATLATELVSQPGTSAVAAPPSAADLSMRLQALLGQHSVLAADMMRGRLRGDPDFAQAANAALGRNTDAMGDVVG